MILDEKKKTVIPDSSILYIEASINYSIIHRIHSTKPVITYARTIKVLQERLGAGFVRISRKHLKGVTLKISRRYQKIVNPYFVHNFKSIT